VIQTFTVLTVPANELCRGIHNGGKNPFRMPLIIGRDNEERWLDHSLKTEEVKQLMIPFDTDRMDAYPIGKDFLKKSADDPGIVARVAEVKQRR